MSTTDMKIGIMQEIDPDHLTKIVAEATNVVEDFGHDPFAYNTNQLCVVAYGNSPDTMSTDAGDINPMHHDWTGMLIMMTHQVNNKLTPLPEEEVERLRVAFPNQLSEAMAYLSISKNLDNDYQALTIELFESSSTMPELINIMTKGGDVDDAIAYTYNVVYEDFYKFIANA